MSEDRKKVPDKFLDHPLRARVRRLCRGCPTGSIDFVDLGGRSQGRSRTRDLHRVEVRTGCVVGAVQMTSYVEKAIQLREKTTPE